MIPIAVLHLDESCLGNGREGDNPGMTRTPTSEQLPLEFAPTASRLPGRITPMRPTDGEGPFDDAGYFFEPWWPGIRAPAAAG